jgi:glutamyl-Q tRNA(Asp) synthetase
MRAHDFARAHGGGFLLRIEDIDPGRSRPEHIDAIIEDLMWLGLNWDDEIIYQSERLPLYADALDRLKAQGLVYPCFCTRSDILAQIADSAAAPHPGSESGAGGPGGALYPGTCRGIDPSVRAARMLSEAHAWRLDMSAAFDRTGTLFWQNGQDQVRAEPEAFGDVVLARKDAPTSYHLAVVVDDAAQGITDVVRGRDLFEATHVHRLLQALLGLPTPQYHHHALVRGEDGQRLAKRHGAPTVGDLRAAGEDPLTLVAALRSGRLPNGYTV